MDMSSIIHEFMDIHSNILRFLWISIRISLDFYGYPYFNLLLILDPGFDWQWSSTSPKIFSGVAIEALTSTNFHDAESMIRCPWI